MAPDKEHPMLDPAIKDTADKAYGFWNEVGAFVGSHPKTGMMIAFVIGVVIGGVAF